MKKAKKKLVALMLVLAMTFGIAMPVSAESPVFQKVNLTFEDAAESSAFSGSYWSVQNDTLKEGTAWGTTYLRQLLPLDQDLTISFDFYIEYNEVWADSLFGFGLMNADQTAGIFGWVQRSQYGDLLTWRKNGVGGPTSNDGVGDQVIYSANDVTAGNTVYGGVHTAKIVLTGSTGAMAVSVDDKLLYCTNNASLTCGIDAGYFTLRATNTSAYIDNLKIVKSGVSEDYSENFSNLNDAFRVVSGSAGVSCKDQKITGSGYSGIDYKLPTENYRLDMTIKLNAEVSSSNENTLLFGVPGQSFANGAGGYLLHFYNNGTYLFDNSITRSGWYDDNAIISKFTNPANFQNDGKAHTLTLASYGNQFYLLLDGKFFTFGTENTSKVYEAADDLGAGYIRFVGHAWEVSRFDITCFGGNADVASAHFNGIRSVYEAVEKLDSAQYSAYAWNQVLKLRDDCLNAMDAMKDGINAPSITALATDAVAEIEATPKKIVVPEDVVGENQILIGYQISGGSYGEGGLYNYKVGDELPDEEGVICEPIVATMYMQAGTSIRLKDGAGMRWKTNINKVDYEKLIALGATFGTRITSTGSTNHLDIPLVNGLNEGDTVNSYVGAVTNIKSTNHTRVYNGCGYVTMTYADHTTDTKFVQNNDNERTYKYLVSKTLCDVSETAKDGYTNEVQKDEKTVYSPYTLTQYNFMKNIFVGIKANETAAVGTGAQIHILNVSGGKEVVAAGRPGNALSMLITYGGKNVLIDAGDEETKDIVEDYLNSLNIKKLDYVIATHAHEDHIGAMPYMMECFDVDTLIYKEPDWTKIASASTDKSLHDAMITAAKNENVTLVQPNEEGYTISLGEDTYLQIFNCTEVYENMTKDDLNYYSLQTYVVSGTAKAFLASDSVGVFENAGLLDVVGKVDLYQAQHHGQGGEYSPKELIDALQPKATVAATNNATFINQMNVACQMYGKTYATGDAGHLVFEDTYGSFILKGDVDNAWSTAPKVAIEADDLQYETDRRKGTDGNAVIEDWIKPGENSGTAFVLNVPENMTQTSVINIEGRAFYIEGNTQDNRIRIVLNDRVLYDSNVSGLDGDVLDLTFTVSAGDKVYFIAEGTGGTFRMPLEMAIDGKYFCVSHLNHIDPTNDNLAPTSNSGEVYDLFGGFSDKGTYYTRAELLSYASVKVTEIQ